MTDNCPIRACKMTEIETEISTCFSKPTYTRREDIKDHKETCVRQASPGMYDTLLVIFYKGTYVTDLVCCRVTPCIYHATVCFLAARNFNKLP